MSTPADETMQISERELTQLTRDLDEIHHETMPKMQEAVTEWSEINRGGRAQMETPRRSGPSRRTFLLGAGAAAGVATLVACSKSSSLKVSGANSTTVTTAGSTGGGQNLTGDLAIAALGASLENLAVATYGAGLKAATAGQLGTVPQAIATFAMTAQQQHKDHAAAWNSVLTSASKQPISGIDTTVNDAVVKPTFAQVKDVVGLAKLALALEEGASATYLNAINLLSDVGAIKIAASIQPVEMQHAAILNFVLGNYPIPDSFAKTDGARTPSDAIG